MLFKKLSLSVAAIAATCTLASPAQALFGATCIPTLYNCMCSYRVPCPVNDPRDLAQFALEKTQIQEKISILKDIKDPGAMMLKAINGQSPYGIPGIGSIGIDLNGIIGGNLSSLGIPAIGGDLVSQLNNLGIDGNLLSSIASGQLNVDDFVAVAKKAGLDVSTLEQVGLGVDKIAALANGDLEINGVIDLANNLGLEAGVLNDIGITQDLLVNISQGNIDSSKILDIAQKAGVDMSALQAVGLDAATIANLPNAGPDYVASVLQRSGFDSSITTSLGLDAGMIAKISTGELPPSAINQLVKNTGLDPAAIVLPGVNGPIRVTDAPDSNKPAPGGSGMGGAEIVGDQNQAPASNAIRSFNLNDIITIPSFSVPGLDNALDTAKGSPAQNGVFTGDAAKTAAMCATDRSLISDGTPPNGFGDDVENIHMAISGGSISAAVEALDAAMSEGASTSGDGYARSIQVRPIILKAIEAVDTFDQMINESETFQDDVIINDTIKGQLMTARAETASMLTYVASTFAANKMQPDNLSELPIFPETARFREMVKESSRTEAQRINSHSKAQAAASSKSLDEYHEVATQGQGAIKNYNLQNNAVQIRSATPALMDTIDIHEGYKSGLFSLEKVIRNALKVLYGPAGADSAWEDLHPKLLSIAASSPYTDGKKWEVGYARAMSLSMALTAKSSHLLTANTPYRYPVIDKVAATQHDPFKVIKAPVFTGSGEDKQEVYGDELVGVIQYYIEAARRETFYGELRRGDVDHVMTGAFWNEMLTHAPECLSGPIPVSAQALADRPEMFDLDKNCDHLYWSYGDPGDYIDASLLGGADAALWLSKINLDRIENITGGQQSVLSQINEALQTINQSTAAAQLQMAGNATPGENLDVMAATLQKALQDPTFSSSISVPHL